MKSDSVFLHGYFDVDPAILWDVIRHRIPELTQRVEELLRIER